MRVKYLLPLLVLGAFGMLALTACGGSSGNVAQEADAQTSSSASAASDEAAADAVAAEAEWRQRPALHLDIRQTEHYRKGIGGLGPGGPIILHSGCLERLPHEFPGEFRRWIRGTHGVRHRNDRGL